jgi:hypothetical protein
MDMSEPRQPGAGSREALNAAFWDLGLRFQWDEATWGVLVDMEDLQAQIAYYLQHWQPHLLSVYDPSFLAKMVQTHLDSPTSDRMGLEARTSA